MPLHLLERIALATIGGLLYGVPFQWPAFAPLIYFGFVPLMVLLIADRYENTPKSNIFIASLGLYLGHVLGTLPVATESLFGVFFLPGVGQPVAWLVTGTIALLARRMGLPLILAWSLPWVGIEWWWSHHLLGGLPFILLAYTQVDYTPILQLADVFGTPGLSLFVTVINGAFGELAVSAMNRGALAPAFALPRVRRSLIGAALMTVLVLAYGFVRMAQFTLDKEEAGPRLALVQPNTPHYLSNIMEVHKAQLAFTFVRLERGSADLVVFPENALQDLIENPIYAKDFAEAGAKFGAPFLYGAFVTPLGWDYVTHKPEPTPEGYFPIGNGAVLLGKDGSIVQKYHKMHLLPFSEYLPGDELALAISEEAQAAYRRFVHDVLGYYGTAVRGRKAELMTLTDRSGQDWKFWSPVCFDSADIDVAREARLGGADFFVNITSEGDLGRRLYEIMVNINQLRAVENRIAIARGTNTGISCLIGPDGQVRETLRGEGGRRWRDRGILMVDMPILKDRGLTFFTWAGDLVGPTCFGVTLLLLGLLFFRRRRGA